MMLNLFKKKKNKTPELDIKSLEKGNSSIIYINSIFLIYRNKCIKRFQNRYIYKSQRNFRTISHRYNDRKKYYRNRFRKSKRACP